MLTQLRLCSPTLPALPFLSPFALSLNPDPFATNSHLLPLRLPHEQWFNGAAATAEQAGAERYCGVRLEGCQTRH